MHYWDDGHQHTRIAWNGPFARSSDGSCVDPKSKELLDRQFGPQCGGARVLTSVLEVAPQKDHAVKLHDTSNHAPFDSKRRKKGAHKCTRASQPVRRIQMLMTQDRTRPHLFERYLCCCIMHLSLLLYAIGGGTEVHDIMQILEL